MKSIFIPLTNLLAVSVALCQHPVYVNPKIQEVTVFLSGAEIRFKETVSLMQGENVIHFKGLSSLLVPNSVQVIAEDKVEVVSVSTQKEHLHPVEISPPLKILKDSIAVLEEKVEMIANKIDAFEVEKRTLAQNQHIGGTQSGISLVDLSKAADFFRERTLKINNALTLLNNNLKILNNRLVLDKKEFDLKIKKIDTTRFVIMVIVNSKADQPVDFLVRHLVEDAGWEASYNIVATEINKPVTLKYNAQVFNNTGIDWHNVKLSLSTSDVSLNLTRPYLTAWVLNYTSNANEGFLNSIAQNTYQFNRDSVTMGDERAVPELNTSFTIAQTHSIQADGRPHHIGLQSEILQATFEYLAVPKMELSAFLIAKVTGWEKLNLIDGKANVYYGNTYIGESNINTRLIGDTLEFSLGRDNQIVVSRTKIEDKGNTPALVGKRSESFVYEIQIRNNHKVPVLVKVQDQIPVAQEKDIMVEVSDISGSNLDKYSGRLQWINNLGTGEIVHYRIAFVVRYPKNKNVNIRKSRVVRTARYRH